MESQSHTSQQASLYRSRIFTVVGRESPLLPPAPPPPDPDHDLVRTLTTSDIWATRHDDDGYRWGFMGEACQLLYGRPLAGGWDRNTRRILALAEENTP